MICKFSLSLSSRVMRYVKAHQIPLGEVNQQVLEGMLVGEMVNGYLTG